MYQYTSKGYKFVEPDYDEPEQRRQCAKCWAFLPKQETGVSKVHHVIMDDVPFRDVDTGRVEYHRAPRALTQEELDAGKKAEWMEGGEPYWTCSKCGHVHGVDEMFD